MYIVHIKFEEIYFLKKFKYIHYNFSSNETILYTVIWSGDEHLYAMWMNRYQNESHLVHYHIKNDVAIIKEVRIQLRIQILYFFIPNT